MTFTRRDIMGGVGAAAIAASLPMPLRAQSRGDTRAANLLGELAEEHLRLFPETATTLGIDKRSRADLRAKLGDKSAAGQRIELAWLRSAVRRLDALPRGLSPATASNVDTVRTSYQTGIEGYAFPYGDVAVSGWRNGPYPVAQNMGAYLDVPKFLDADHTVETRDDAENYLARLSLFAGQLDAETERLRAQRGQGVVAPDAVLDKTLAALRRSQEGAPAEWMIVTSLARRASDVPGDWQARAERIAGTDVGPALARQLAEIEQHRRVATADFGVWKLPRGADYYAWTLAAATTTRRTPDQVHEQGLDELRRYTGEMDRLMRRLGFTQGSVSDRYRAMTRDRRYAFPEGDAGRAQIIAFIEAQLAELRPRLPQAFGTLVAGNVEVRRIPPAEELGAPGAYGGAGSIDGSTPGRFWINLRSTDMHSRIDLPSLTYHEAIPGHVWAGEYANRLPLARAVTVYGFSAFSEGWALYGEQLAGELGVYEDNPEGQLGFYQSMAFRAARLVVDTGIHAKRWTRDRALDWFAEATGGTRESVANEIDRYAVWPGQACGYKVGHTEINRQREKARTALGRRFDLKAFNDVVVGGGSRPLTVVEREVDRMIAGARRG